MEQEIIWRIGEEGDKIVQLIERVISQNVQAALEDYFKEMYISYSQYDETGNNLSDKLSAYFSFPDPMDRMSRRVPISELIRTFADDYGCDREDIDQYLLEIELAIATVRADPRYRA